MAFRVPVTITYVREDGFPVPGKQEIFEPSRGGGEGWMVDYEAHGVEVTYVGPTQKLGDSRVIPWHPSTRHRTRTSRAVRRR